MKKLFGISLVAMLVATPMVASATLPANYSNGQSATMPTITPNAHVATTSYVQGAYNTAINYLNQEYDARVAADNTINQTMGTVAATGVSGATSIADAISRVAAATGGTSGAQNSAFTQDLTVTGENGSAALGEADTISEAINNVAHATDLNTAAISAEEQRATGVESGLNARLQAVEATTLAVYGDWSTPDTSTGSIALFQ